MTTLHLLHCCAGMFIMFLAGTGTSTAGRGAVLPRAGVTGAPVQVQLSGRGGPGSGLPPHPLQASLTQVLQEVKAISTRVSRLQESQSELHQKVDRIMSKAEARERSCFKIDKSNYQVSSPYALCSSQRLMHACMHACIAILSAT